jgi:hypothetical protein
MSEFVAERAVRSHSFTLELPARRAFTLFEPEGERAWAVGWNPRYLHPRDGRAERGMVFTTDHGNESTIWTMIRHEPRDGVVEYVRLTPGSRIGNVLVQCAALDAAHTRVTVIYSLTGLTEAGNKTLRDLDEAKFAAFVDSWKAAIAAIPAR